MGVLRKISAELLGPLLAAKTDNSQSKKLKKDFMMKFMLVLFLSTSTLAMPTPQEQPEQTWSDWAQDQSENLVEGIIQRLITSAREVLNTVNGQTDIFWSKVKQMEVEVYKVNNVL